MITSISRILALLSPKDRYRAFGLLFFVLVMALLDVAGVASIMPFMAVLSDPEIINENSILREVYDFFEFSDSRSFLFFLGVAVFFTLVFSLAFKTFVMFLQLRFTFLQEYYVAKRLLEGYLNQPYTWFLGRNSSDLGKSILSEITTGVGNGLLPFIQLVSQSVVVLALVTLLIVVDPVLAFSTAIALGACYFLVYKSVNGFMFRVGKERLKANEIRYKVVSEAFGSAKEMKLAGLEKVFLGRFSEPAIVFAKGHSVAQSILQLPRYLIEAIAFGGMILILLFLLDKEGELSSALPIVSLYALAGYRLIPALQSIYTSATSLRYVTTAVDALYEDVSNFQGELNYDQGAEKLDLLSKISLKNVTFRYPKTSIPAIDKVCLEIPVNKTIGIVGQTGSGKTTLVDIILGLLSPQNGSISIDDTIVGSGNLRNWQNQIGYVPQSIYLLDESIIANIAFGVDPEDVDFDAVERASKIANLDEFVKTNLPNGYKTIVGERGVRLSGGQRQRIGIARALYHNPRVLVLDEATSALDNITEKEVMKAVKNLENKITIIMIAHRLSTVKDCDVVHLIDNGCLLASGSFEELQGESEYFRKLASESSKNKIEKS